MKNKILTFLALSLSISAFAAGNGSQLVVCGNENSTFVKMELDRSGAKSNRVLSIVIKGTEYLSEKERPVRCQRSVNDGSSSDICDLGNGLKASVFLTSYAPHSGIILYAKNRHIDDDLGLKCLVD